MDTTFKTTVFGGFDKQDVVAYIEKAARESGERIAALEKERDELAAARLEWEREGETLRETSQELQRRCDLLEVELAEKRTAEETVRSQSQELEGLRAEVERLRNIESEYQTYRAHMVDVELESRQRADKIHQEAQERADQLLRETEERCGALRSRLRKEFHEMVGNYGALRSDFVTLAGHVSGELRKMDVAVSQLPLSFDHLRDSLEALEQDAE